MRWRNSWFVILRQESTCGYSVAPSGMGGAWRKKCGIFRALPPRKNLPPPADWELKSPPCSGQAVWRRIFLNFVGIVLACQATLATRNTSHFEDLSVPVINPWAWA